MPTKCTITGTVVAPDGLPVALAQIEFGSAKVRPMTPLTIAPESATATTDEAGALTVELYPGEYSVRAMKTGRQRYPTFSITVPETSSAVLADIIDLPPPVSLDAAGQAVLAAQAARDAAVTAAADAAAAVGEAGTGGAVATAQAVIAAEAAVAAAEDALAAAEARALAEAARDAVDLGALDEAKAQTEADRVQTGLDRAAAAVSANAATDAATAATAAALPLGSQILWPAMTAIPDGWFNTGSTITIGGTVRKLLSNVYIELPERLVATRTSTPDGLNPSATQLFCRTLHTAQEDLSQIKAAFANWFVLATGVESLTGATATVRASLEYPLGTTPVRITFSGSNAALIPDGDTVISDPLSVSIPEGAQFAIKTLYENPNGSLSTIVNRNNATERQQTGTGGLADLTLTATLPNTLSTSAYAPVAILGLTNKPAIMFIGDSRVRGTGDDAGIALKGELERSLGSLAFTNAARASAAISTISTSGVGAYSRRVALGNAYCTHVISNFGINDVGGGQTSAQILTNLETLSGLFTIPFYQSTLSPYATSTDGWATVENQTPTANEARRVAVNAAIRARPAWLDGYFEVADVTESARDSGRWKAGYTADGVHANAVGYSAIASSGAITPTPFV